MVHGWDESSQQIRSPSKRILPDILRKISKVRNLPGAGLSFFATLLQMLTLLTVTQRTYKTTEGGLSYL